MWRTIDINTPRTGDQLRVRDGTGEPYWCSWWSKVRCEEYYNKTSTDNYQNEFGWYEYFGPNEEDGAWVEPTHWYDPS